MRRRFLEGCTGGSMRSRCRGRRKPPQRPIAPDPDRWNPNYIDPGHNVVRLTLFLVSNYCGTVWKILTQLQITRLMLAQHGMGLSLIPDWYTDERFQIKVPFNRPTTGDRLLKEEGDFDWLRGEAAGKFNDQTYGADNRPRLPVFLCEHNRGHGVTRLQKPAGNSTSTWLPYVLISGASGCPDVAILHEAGHAARNSLDHDQEESPTQPELRNFMREAEPGQTMYKYQIMDLLAKPRSYFVGPPARPKK